MFTPPAGKKSCLSSVHCKNHIYSTFQMQMHADLGVIQRQGMTSLGPAGPVCSMWHGPEKVTHQDDFSTLMRKNFCLSTPQISQKRLSQDHYRNGNWNTILVSRMVPWDPSENFPHGMFVTCTSLTADFRTVFSQI